MPKKIVPSAYDVIHGTYDVILAKNNVKNEVFDILPIDWFFCRKYVETWRRYERHEIIVFRAPPTFTDSKKNFEIFSEKLKKNFF